MAAEIHPTAIVDHNAQIADGTVVGPYSIISPHVVIKERCVIGPHAVVEGRTTLGAGCRVSQFASLGAPPQDLKFRGEPSTLEIGEDNVMREYVTLQPGTEHGRMRTVIGKGNLFMASSHVAHDCIVGDYNVFANSAALGGHVTIGTRVILGGLSAVHQFCRVGDFAILSGGTMAGLDVPHFCIAQGDRCRLRGLNLIGLQRAGFSPQEVNELKRAYRVLFHRLGSFSAKIAELPAELSDRPLIRRWIEFVEGSERGITSAVRD